MSVYGSQFQGQAQGDQDKYNTYQNYEKADQQSNQKHFNEFLVDSYDENDKKNHCTIGIAPDTISVHESQGEIPLNSEQERHINELIDNYNSQMEFYKPNKKGIQNKKEFKNDSSQIKGDSQIKNDMSPLKQSNHLNQLPPKQQYQQQNVDNQEKPIPLTAVLAEERQKHSYLQQSGVTQAQGQPNDDYEVCPNCSRKFFPGRLNLHLKSCKPNKPLKPVKKQQSEKDDTQQLSPQKKDISNVSFSKTGEQNERAKNITPSKNDQYMNDQQPKPQAYNRSYIQQTSTQDNSERDETNATETTKYNLEQFEHKINNQMYEQQGEDTRVECDMCGRKFMQERIEKHQVACQKSQKARPVYNSSAARCPIDENGNKLIQKTNLLPPKAAKKASEQTVVPTKSAVVEVQAKEQSIPNENSSKGVNSGIKANNNTQKETSKASSGAAKKSENEGKTKKIPKWKLEHQQFIENIRYNKLVKEVEKEGGDVSKIEKPVDDLEALGYVQCQYCQRKFAKDTADRHIPLCKNIINRPKPPRQPSRQNSEKVTGSANQNGDARKAGVKKINAKNNYQSDDQESQMKSNISSNGDSQQQTNDNSDQASLFSNKTLNTTGGGYNPPIQKLSSKISSAVYDKQNAEQNQKSRTGLLPDINAKQSDKKYFTSRKFGHYNNSNGTINNPNNRNSNPNNSSNTDIQKQKLHEDIYSRVQQISTIQCPYCDRNFAKHAAERHVPICKNIVNRPNPLNEYSRNTRQSLPKKVSAQQAIYTQRQSLGHNQQSPRQSDTTNRLLIDGQNFQKPRTSDSSSFTKIPNSLNSTKPTNFCGFCGFQFAMDHKYCGSCGKKRFSTAKQTIASSNTQLGSKSNFDNSNSMTSNKATNLD